MNKQLLKPVVGLFIALIVGVAESTTLYAQLEEKQTEAVYGGSIRGITGYAQSDDTSVIFVSTESANTAFYAYVTGFLSSTPVISDFHVMEGLDDAAGYGSNVNNIAAHKRSGYLLLAHGQGLLSSHPGSNTVNTLAMGNVASMLVKEDYLLFVQGNSLNYGTLDENAAYTSGGTPITLSRNNPSTIVINPEDSLVYIYPGASTPSVVLKSSVRYFEINSSTTFEEDTFQTLNSSVSWTAFGIAPDGRFFVAGTGLNGKTFSYSDDQGQTWVEPIEFGGVGGPTLAFLGDALSYNVYYASAYSNAKGESGSWNSFGNPGGFETHPNDGVVFVDPNGQVVYMTTDQGLGASLNGGSTIFEIDNGIEAVQMRDFDMTSDKRTAWLASKAGVRVVTDYATENQVWSVALFPMGDGSPYYSAAVKRTDGNTAYVGNSRVYKTTDGGANWTRVFTAENSFAFGTIVKRIKVCPFDENIVMAGYNSNGQGGDLGGLFVSMDAGQNWSQVLIQATSNGPDVNVNDILFNQEGADLVAYVSVEMPQAGTSSWGTYRLVKQVNDSWTVTQDMGAASSFSQVDLMSSISNIEVLHNGNVIVAVGKDYTTNRPAVYYKSYEVDTVWHVAPTGNLANGEGQAVDCITAHNDTVYASVANQIFYMPIANDGWTVGATNPVGNNIAFLYFDDLLIGSATSLKGAVITPQRTSAVEPIHGSTPFVKNFSVAPNPITTKAMISYNVGVAGAVSLDVYDLMGKKVATVVNQNQSKGSYSIDYNMEGLPNGIYYFTLKTEEGVKNITTILAR